MNELHIRRAEDRDTAGISALLYQVHKVHSDVRPDIFITGGIKYTERELKEIIHDDSRPIFVAEADGAVIGYAFCVHICHENDSSLTDINTLYIDDLCVDENVRGMHTGTSLYGYVVDYARKSGCYNVTLNVWADNKGALKFYEKIGMKVQKIGMEKIL